MGKGLEKIKSYFISLKWHLRKLFIIWIYFLDYKNHRDIRLTVILIKYLFLHKTNNTDLIVNTHFGKYFIRKNTMDFKMANRAYEWKVVSIFKKECNKADLVLDIGSNSGMYGIMAAKQGIKTYAFEPITDNYNVLLNNIELNNLNDKIIAFDFALGDSPKNAVFNFNTFNTGSASINKLKASSEEREVKIVVFDELEIPELKTAKNILVKMDVEGMEIPVIKGLKNLLKSNLNLVFIVETKHTSKKEIVTELSKYANFKFKRIDDFNMLATKKSNLINILC